MISRAQYLTAAVGEMRPGDYDSLLMVKAVKGLTFHNYATMLIGGRWTTVREANKDIAIDWFVEWAAPVIAAIPGAKVIVPIPSSKSTPASAPTFRTAVIAEKLAAATANAVSAPHVRFLKERPNSREEGGSRDPHVIRGELTLIQQMPLGTLILLDDVLTGGGHLKACTWLLNDHGLTVSMAICCGRTCEVQLPDPFSVPPESLSLVR